MVAPRIPPQGGDPMITPWGRIAMYRQYPWMKLINNSPLVKHMAFAAVFPAGLMFYKLYSLENSPEAQAGWAERRKEYYEPVNVKY
jgi:hypothetical protein